MSIRKTFETPWLALVSNVAATGDNGFSVASDWSVGIPAARIISARATVEMERRTGVIEIVPAINFANVPAAPDQAYSALPISAAWVSSEGVTYPTTFTSVASLAQQRQLARFGWSSRNTSGTTLSTCQARATFDLELYATYERYELAWRYFMANSTTAVFHPGTEWKRTTKGMQVRGNVELRSPAGNFEAQLGFQLANDVASPDNAAGNQFGPAVTTAGSAFPTGWVTPSVDGRTLIRFGWFTRVTSAGTGLGSVWGQVEVVA